MTGARFEHPSTLSASRSLLLRIQSLAKQHFDVRLVPQTFLGGKCSRSREIAFRQPDGYSRRWPGLAGSIACQPRDGSLPQFARCFGLLEAVRNEVLVFRPPLS